MKKLDGKTFLSTGNQYTEINLRKDSTTLIVGTNGTGKSTVLDALTFALFGKPFRKINKPQLPNSTNEKDCRVEVEFSIGNTDWKVIRGIKPNVFEIWRNDSPLDQSAAAVRSAEVVGAECFEDELQVFHSDCNFGQQYVRAFYATLCFPS